MELTHTAAIGLLLALAAIAITTNQADFAVQLTVISPVAAAVTLSAALCLALHQAALQQAIVQARADATTAEAGRIARNVESAIYYIPRVGEGDQAQCLLADVHAIMRRVDWRCAVKPHKFEWC